MKLFLTVSMAVAFGLVGLAKEPGAASVDVRGTVSEVHVVPAGSPLVGVHVTLKTKAGEALDVYLAPRDFLNMLKMTVAVGDEIRAIGSRTGNTILTKEFFKKGTSIVLRDDNGAPVWENWGVEAAAAATGI